MKNKSFYFVFFGLAIVIYVVTAINSSGFFHADEHYQIIEFAQYKLGKTDERYLAWEFAARIRPAFQPYLAYLFFSGIELIGVSNPYSQMTVLRVLTGLFSLATLTFFFISTRHVFISKRARRMYFVGTLFFWFFPLLAARFSSENLAGLFFILGLSVFFNPSLKNNKELFIGLLFGISFLFRFQMAFGIVGFALALLINRGLTFRNLIGMGLPFIFLLVIGVGVDYLFYEEWLFTPYNYFEANIIEGAAESFGTEPFLWYFTDGTSWILMPWSILLFSSLLAFLLFKRSSFSFWIFIIFALGHSLVGHKEMRFMFPIAYLFPFIIFVGVKLYYQRLNWLKNSFFQWSVLLIIILSGGIGLTVNMFKSAGKGYTKVTQYIHNNYRNNKITVYHTKWSQPYTFWGGDFNQFYKERDVRFIEIPFDCNFQPDSIRKGEVHLLAIRKEGEQFEKCPNQSFVGELEVQSIPQWMEPLLRNYSGFRNQDILQIYRIKRK